MRTTIDLPDELLRQAKARAALSGVSLKDLITRYVERGLQAGPEPAAGASRRRGELPQVIAPSGRRMPALSNADIQAILEIDDLETCRDGPG